ncbi:MAG: zinc-binding dehydrogenase [Candidatus Eisenbacteria sp.]|nr:zinc-binding dehydrogenase [Candidatus Eisenbacteria bacterium]
MQAYVIAEHGGPEVLRVEERPAPEPGPREVRLRILAAGLNHLDLWVRRGVPGHRFPLPLIPGSDGCGRVEALGTDVRGIAEGECYLLSPGFGCGECAECLRGEEPLCRHYVILGESRDGTCAETITVPAATLVPLPAGLAPEEAVALPLVLMTTWRMLIRRAHLRVGETVLVQAGGSGIGSMAIQIAAAFACRVITTVGSPEKARRAKELGAEEVILYREQDVPAAVRSWTRKRGVDVVVEHTGEETWEGSVRCLARGGRLVTCGATTGAAASIDLRVLFFKQLSLLGSTMGARSDLREALHLVAQGRIRPLVDRTFPLDDLAAAHRTLEERRVFGKVTLRGWEC